MGHPLARATLIVICACSAATRATAAEPELGRVRWDTDLDAARSASRRTGRPILLLNTRTPGAADCKLLGAGALSHPIVVDAALHEFVPVVATGDGVTAQRGGGADGAPSIRILNAAGDEVAPALTGAASAGDVLAAMVGALRTARREVPEYLDLVAWGYNPARPKTAVFTFT